ncbi:MAG: DUF63 family protein [Salinirussus sp.]
MTVPFRGFALPPLPHAVALGAATAAVVVLLYVTRPRTSERVVLAFAPWMVCGGALHVLFQLGRRTGGVDPRWVEPFLAAPAVYLTTFVGMGAVWGGATRRARDASEEAVRPVAVVGTAVAALAVGAAVLRGLDPAFGPLRPFVPVVGLTVAGLLAAGVHVALDAWDGARLDGARRVGALVLFAHLFDGVTTAIGIDLLGAGERSVLPARIIEFAAGLPTAPLLGSGWLFVLVKLLVAAGVVVLFADLAREEPEQGYLLFAVVAAVGLGPATNNVLLFFLGG